MGGRVGLGGGGQRGLGHRFAAAWVRVRGCGRRLGTGTCVSVHQTTTMVVCGLGRAFLSGYSVRPPLGVSRRVSFYQIVSASVCLFALSVV